MSALFIILVSLTMTRFSEKSLFPLDAYMVSCPTWPKNLGRTLLLLLLSSPCTFHTRKFKVSPRSVACTWSYGANMVLEFQALNNINQKWQYFIYLNLTKNRLVKGTLLSEGNDVLSYFPTGKNFIFLNSKISIILKQQSGRKQLGWLSELA